MLAVVKLSPSCGTALSITWDVRFSVFDNSSWLLAIILMAVSIEEGCIKKRRQRSTLLFWETEFIQFLAALSILHQDDLKNRMNSSYSSYLPGEILPFLHITLVKFILFFISSWCNSFFLHIIILVLLIIFFISPWFKFCPSNSSDDLCLLFCINPSSMDQSQASSPVGGSPPPTNVCKRQTLLL